MHVTSQSCREKRASEAVHLHSQSILEEGLGKTDILKSGKVKLLEYLNEKLQLREVEKQLYGDVYTPLELVDEMLSKFDEYAPEVWTNPNLKWLDPASGRGNFPVIAYYKLMNGLKEVIPNAEDRHNHIIQNMLYMVELNAVNALISKKIFGADANVFQGDFLEDKWYDHFGIKKFDIIMGNPPYNQGGTKRQGESRLWIKFIIKSIELLNNDKYMIMIHPSQWRNPSPKYKEINQILLENQILFLRMLSIKMSQDLFNATIQTDYYILQKTKPYKKTIIIDTFETKNENLLKVGPIANQGISIIGKINKMIDKYGDLSEFKTYNEFNASTIKSIEKKTIRQLEEPSKIRVYPILRFIRKNGEPSFFYTSNPHSLQNIPKIVTNNGFYLSPLYDNGTFGIGHGIYCLINNPSPRLYKFLISKLVTFIDKSTRTGNNITSELFKKIPDIRNVPESELPEITDESLYKFFRLTPEEIALVEQVAAGKGESFDEESDCGQFVNCYRSKIEKYRHKKDDKEWNYWIDKCVCDNFNKSDQNPHDKKKLNPLTGTKTLDPSSKGGKYGQFKKYCDEIAASTKADDPPLYPLKDCDEPKTKKTKAKSKAEESGDIEISKNTNCNEFRKSNSNIFDSPPPIDKLWRQLANKCICEQFEENKNKNPITGRAIKEGTPTYKKISKWIEQWCKELDQVSDELDLLDETSEDTDVTEDEETESVVENYIDIVNKLANIGYYNLHLILDLSKKGDTERDMLIQKMRSIINSHLQDANADEKKKLMLEAISKLETIFEELKITIGLDGLELIVNGKIGQERTDAVKLSHAILTSDIAPEPRDRKQIFNDAYQYFSL